jgi:N-acetylglucosaminyldiphosphoundecaprenol N-acetyl-beta-D-mannosaminyltransferase
MVLKKDGNIFKILEIELISSSLEEVLGLIEQRIAKKQRTFVVTPNPEFLVFSREAPWFKRILIQSDIAIPDGVALLWAREVLKKNSLFGRLLIGFLTGLKVIFAGWGQKRVNGTDLMEKLCQLAAGKGWGVYLLGGKPGIAQKTLEILQNRYPGLEGWVETGPKLEIVPRSGIWLRQRNSQLEIGKLVEEINQKQPTFLFVAFGMGKQEKFIWDNWGKLNVRVAIGVGGAFDYLSSQVKRAPKWIQNMGFEWFYRLCREPRRWKRQLRLLEFIWLVLRGKSSQSK